jgi:hypothetical protein
MGTLQTIVGNFLPRPAFPGFTTTFLRPSKWTRRRQPVLCHCHWQPEAGARSARLTVVLVHGLEGSSDSRYVQGIAARAWAAGMQRCAHEHAQLRRSDALTPTLYHSGLGRCGRGGAPFCGASSAWSGSTGRLLDGRQPGAQTGRGVGRRMRRLLRWPRFVRPSTWPPAPTLCTSRRTDPMNGIFCAADAPFSAQGGAVSRNL